MICSFEIFAAGTTFSSITGSPYDNAALSDALNQKADNSTVETLSETVENNYTELPHSNRRLTSGVQSAEYHTQDSQILLEDKKGIWA